MPRIRKLYAKQSTKIIVAALGQISLKRVRQETKDNKNYCLKLKLWKVRKVRGEGEIKTKRAKDLKNKMTIRIECE